MSKIVLETFMVKNFNEMMRLFSQKVKVTYPVRGVFARENNKVMVCFEEKNLDELNGESEISIIEGNIYKE